MIIWHLDDLKISRVENKVVEDIINKLKKIFKECGLLSTSRGKIPKYL